MKRNLLIILCLLGILGIGLGSCSDDSEPNSPVAPAPVDTLPPVFKLTHDAYDALLDSLKGNVVVVNVYAYWCGPCMQELPSIIKLHDTYKDKGVFVLMLSVDDIARLETHVRITLDKRGVEFPTYIVEPGNWGSFKESIDPAWRDAIPFTVILDREGVHRFSWTGSESYTTFEEHVLELL